MLLPGLNPASPGPVRGYRPPGSRRWRVRARSPRSAGAILLTASAVTCAGDADGVDAVDGLAAVGLGVGEVRKDVGQPGVRVEDGRHVVDVGGGPEVLVGAAGVSAAKRLPSATTKSTSSSRWPRKMMLALPCAATAGVLVRSPSRDSIGSSCDLALHGELQMHARLGLGGLAGLLQQGGGVRQRPCPSPPTSRSTRRRGRWWRKGRRRWPRGASA